MTAPSLPSVAYLLQQQVDTTGNASVTYEQISGNPITLSLATMKLGTNVRALTGPAGKVTVKIPDTGDERMVIAITDERDEDDQDEITVQKV